MIPQQWKPPCNAKCTQKYTAMQIPWRVYCKKGCDSDGDTWDECLTECDEKCYKDPVFKDCQWTAFLDRSPGAADYSEECFHACVSGCGYKHDIPAEKVSEVHPTRPPPPPPVKKQTPAPVKSRPPPESIPNIPSTSA